MKKRLKLAAHEKMCVLLSTPAELLTYIAKLEREQSPVLQGVISTRSRDWVIKAKKWAESQLLMRAVECSVAHVSP